MKDFIYMLIDDGKVLIYKMKNEKMILIEIKRIFCRKREKFMGGGLLFSEDREQDHWQKKRPISGRRESLSAIERDPK